MTLVHDDPILLKEFIEKIKPTHVLVPQNDTMTELSNVAGFDKNNLKYHIYKISKRPHDELYHIYLALYYSFDDSIAGITFGKRKPSESYEEI